MSKYIYAVYTISDVELYALETSIYDSRQDAHNAMAKHINEKNNTFDYELWKINKNVWNGKQELLEHWSFGDDLPEVKK